MTKIYQQVSMVPANVKSVTVLHNIFVYILFIVHMSKCKNFYCGFHKACHGDKSTLMNWGD